MALNSRLGTNRRQLSIAEQPALHRSAGTLPPSIAAVQMWGGQRDVKAHLVDNARCWDANKMQLAFANTRNVQAGVACDHMAGVDPGCSSLYQFYQTSTTCTYYWLPIRTRPSLLPILLAGARVLVTSLQKALVKSPSVSCVMFSHIETPLCTHTSTCSTPQGSTLSLTTHNKRGEVAI